MLRIYLTLIFLLTSAACAYKPTSELINAEQSCRSQLEFINTKEVDFQLNSISTLFSRECYWQVIELGKTLRDKNRDKYYSLSKEAMEVIVYEGASKDYVLDAHERIYLSILLSISYLKMNRIDSARVELKRTYEESVAEIYKAGTDQVNVLLQGILWLNLYGPNEAEPFFKKIDQDNYDEHLKIFAKDLFSKAKKDRKKVSLTAVNYMPNVRFEWFSIYSRSYSPEPKVKSCITDNSILLTTDSWVKNIENRDNPNQDPVLNYKRAFRLPAAILYSASVLAVGGGLTYLIGSAGNGSAGELAAVVGMLTLYGTYRTFINSLAPDMRYWREMPDSFYISYDGADPETDACMRRYNSYSKKTKLVSL